MCISNNALLDNHTLNSRTPVWPGMCQFHISNNGVEVDQYERCWQTIREAVCTCVCVCVCQAPYLGRTAKTTTSIQQPVAAKSCGEDTQRAIAQESWGEERRQLGQRCVWTCVCVMQ
jgi:hypothetical protein